MVAQQVLDREQHAIGRRAVDRVAPRRQLVQAEWAAGRQRMAGAALLLLGRYDPDILCQLARDFFQQLDAGRLDPVIVGDQDPALLAVDRSVSHARRSLSARP